MSKNSLRYVLIDKSNLDEATRFQNEIFPHNDAYRNYYESVFKLRDAEYYLAYLDKTLVGMVGIYHENVDPESAWLGWFGVKNEFRRHHLGSEILGFFEKLAKEKGFKYARLFTDEFNNDAAISFYKKCGYISEKYINSDDAQSLLTKVLIFSKSLTDEPCILWDNKSINLTEQYKKELFRKKN